MAGDALTAPRAACSRLRCVSVSVCSVLLVADFLCGLYGHSCTVPCDITAPSRDRPACDALGSSTETGE